MPYQATVYRVLIASPSDLVRERELIPGIIHRWNDEHSADMKVALLPVKWETHATPAMGDRPQAIINKQIVEKTDILVGAFWTKLGTPTGKADSGTAEEIEEFIAAGKPVMLYFSMVPVVPGSYDEQQYAKLAAFREKCQTKGLYFTYSTTAELEDMLYRHLTAKVREVNPSPADSKVAPTANPLPNLAMDFQAFVRRLEAEWKAEQSSGDWADVREGKRIIGHAAATMVQYRGLSAFAENAGIASLMDKILGWLRQLDKHLVSMDGGVSFREFWSRGDTILGHLHELATLVNKMTEGG